MEELQWYLDEYRAYYRQRSLERSLGATGALATTCVVFLVQHPLPDTLLPLTFVGLLLWALALRSERRSLVASISAHAAHHFTLVTAFLVLGPTP